MAKKKSRVQVHLGPRYAWYGRWQVVRTQGAAPGEDVQRARRRIHELMRAPQSSLKRWGEQKWRTKSGKKSSETGERYLPEAAIKSLSASEYAATTAAKRRDKKRGKQFSKQPKSIMRKTRRFR